MRTIGRDGNRDGQKPILHKTVGMRPMWAGFSPSSRNIIAMRTLMVLLFAAAPALALPPHEAASAARDWRVKHEKEIVAELSALVAIPNLASDKPNIERNAAALVEAFTRRGAKVKLLRIEGAPPLVVATVNVGRVLN